MDFEEIHLECLERHQFECRRGIIRDSPQHDQRTRTGQPAAGAQSLSPSPVGVGDGAGGDFVDPADRGVPKFIQRRLRNSGFVVILVASPLKLLLNICPVLRVSLAKKK